MQREFTARGIPFIRARRDFPREKLGFSVLSARSVAGRAKIKASSQFPCGEFPLLLAAYCAISLSLFEPARILEFVSWVPLERVSSREGKMGGERIDFLFFFPREFRVCSESSAEKRGKETLQRAPPPSISGPVLPWQRVVHLTTRVFTDIFRSNSIRTSTLDTLACGETFTFLIPVDWKSLLGYIVF